MQISSGEKGTALLGYLPFIGLLMLWPVKARRDSLFVQYNLRQGAVLFLMFLLVAVVSFVVLFFAPTVGFLVFFVDLLVYAFFALAGIIKVLQGERYRMPGVADVALALRL